MAYANPSLTFRPPVHPADPVSNIDWTGLRDEQDYPSFQRRQRLGFPMHVPFVRLEWRVKTAHANPSFTIRHPVNPIHPVSNIDWTGLRGEQALSVLPASPEPPHFPSSFLFVRLERRVKMALANPPFTIRNP